MSKILRNLKIRTARGFEMSVCDTVTERRVPEERNPVAPSALYEKSLG